MNHYRSSMTNSEIVSIIHKVLAMTESVVAQLKAEKKAKGDYSKSLTVQDGDLRMRFDAMEYRGKYPTISVNLLFFVIVFRDNVPLMKCRVANIKHQNHFHFDFLNGHYNCSDKYKLCALVCDHSQVKPLFRSGDSLCIDNNGKAAFAKVEILSEKLEEQLTGFSVECLRRIRLSKELGHKETLAYTKCDEMETYVADDSTQEFFGNEDVKEMDLSTYYKTEEKHAGDYSWLEYTKEDTHYDSKLKFTVPATEAEILIQLKQKSLDAVLDTCRSDFCYGYHRVEKLKDGYMILGEEIINTIYQEYKAWLNKNCTTYTQEGADCTGVAIDWQGKEDYQPHFDVRGDELKIEFYDDLWEKLPLTPYRDFLIISYWYNRHLDAPYDDFLDYLRNAACNGKVCLELFKLGYDPRSVAQFFSKLTPNMEHVFVDAVKKLERAYDTYPDDYEEYERKGKTLLGRKQ